MKWILLIVSLPTHNATARMRVWRAVKASGAAVLRDGVYLLPYSDIHWQLLDEIARDVQLNQGSAQILPTETGSDATEFASVAPDFVPLFDRTTDYQNLLVELTPLQQQLQQQQLQPQSPQQQLPQQAISDLLKQLRKLRKNFAAIMAIDFFPNEQQTRTQDALQALEKALNRQLSPDEPHGNSGEIALLSIADYQQRHWATRKRPWVDRLASAWLIRRFIDPQAQFIWLESPADCPPQALGFDFDGARFTHINNLVSFEVLLASFALEQPGLKRLATIIHFLDAGGMQPQEASGLEQILWGLRNSISDDDQLLTAATSVFDALFSAFSNKE